jgi:hypothetical protein
MSLKKFGDNDIILNTMKTRPACEFFVFNGKIYYNDTPEQSGAFNSRVLNVPPGHVSLYEYNIDKNANTNKPFYPFITKQSSNTTLGTVSSADYNSVFEYGDTVTGSYPLSASITREYMVLPGTRSYNFNEDTKETFVGAATYPHFYALKNRLDFYGTRSKHYKVSSSYGDKSTQTSNLISIPSIFYGSRITTGSMSLKWYFTGSLIGELRDTKHNGELIEVSGSNVGAVAGVVLYDEGFVYLTGSWALGTTKIGLASGASADWPKWIYFGAGANDGVTVSSAAASYISASYSLSFRGTNEVQVLTMFAHARRGEANYSNNPTFLKYGQTLIDNTSSQIYEENSNRTIFNTVSSSYSDYQAPFKRQVYVSRVAVYDENKNLIGVATLANPVLKEEDQDLTFKLRLDI